MRYSGLRAGRIGTLIRAVFFIFLVAFLMPSLAANAKEEGDSTVSLQLTPTQQSFELEPGQIYRGTVTVTNLGDTAIDVEPSASSYYPANEDYSPDYNAQNEYTLLAGWVSFEQETVTLEPDVPTEIAYTITVPEDVPAGGQYAAVLISSVDTAGATFKASGSVGSILMAQVAGETREEAEFLSQDFSTMNISSDPTFTTTLKNTGNVDFRASATITIKNVFSGEYVYDDTDTPYTASVFPDTTRMISTTAEGLPEFGIFQATYTVEYLGEEQTVDKLLIRVPLWLVLVCAFCLVFLIVFIIAKVIGGMKAKKQQRLGLEG